CQGCPRRDHAEPWPHRERTKLASHHRYDAHHRTDRRQAHRLPRPRKASTRSARRYCYHAQKSQRDGRVARERARCHRSESVQFYLLGVGDIWLSGFSKHRMMVIAKATEVISRWSLSRKWSLPNSARVMPPG